MIHTFSPNWYKPQCLLFDGNTLYYASNYVLYKYNLDVRKVQVDRCFRKVAIKSGMNSKDIKIHTIKKISDQVLIIGTNQPDAVLVNSQNLSVLSIIRNIGLKNAHLCSTGVYLQTPYALFTDQNGELSKVIFKNLNQYQIQKLPQLLPKEKVKQILNLSNIGLIIYGKGHMVLFDRKFDKIIQEVSPSKIGLEQQSVLSIDTFEENNILWACMLTRGKSNDIFVHYWSIVVNQQNGKSELLFKKIIKCQIKIIYPKVMNQKIKNAQKAAMTIKFLNSYYLLLTGKLGEILILKLHQLPETVTIKPQSIDDLPNYVEILNDSKHYKEIYAVYVHQRPKSNVRQLFTISTDQTMNVWKIIDNSIQNIYSIKFITSEVASIFYCEADPKTVFFLLKDSNIRSATPLSTQNYFLNQYWKFTKKFKILKAVNHLQELGVCAMVTECGRVLVYDLFDDRMMKLFDFQVKNPNDQIINISFEYKTIMEAIHKMTQKIEPDIQNQWKIQKIKSNTYYTKFIKNNAQIGILVQQKSRLSFIHQGEEKEHDVVACIKRTLRIQRIHNTKLWDNNSLLFTQSKSNTLKLWFFYKGKVLSILLPLKLGGRCIFKIDPLYLRVFQFKGKKVWIYTFNIQEDLKIVNELEFQLPLFTQQAVIDYHSCQVIFYNGKDDLFALLQFNNAGGRVSSYDTGNKIQNLTFYLKEYVAIGFKDQSIKILKVADLTSLKDQPQKRVKKLNKEQSMIDQKVECEIKQSSNMMSLQQ